MPRPVSLAFATSALAMRGFISRASCRSFLRRLFRRRLADFVPLACSRARSLA